MMSCSLHSYILSHQFKTILEVYSINTNLSSTICIVVGLVYIKISELQPFSSPSSKYN